MSMITDLLDSLDIPYIEDGYAPGRPPQTGPCIVWHDDYETGGSDLDVLYTVHSYTLDLYDEGYENGKAVRKKVADALRAANLKFQRTEPYYIYSEKRWMTVFELDDYITKEYTND